MKFIYIKYTHIYNKYVYIFLYNSALIGEFNKVFIFRYNTLILTQCNMRDNKHAFIINAEQTL